MGGSFNGVFTRVNTRGCARVASVPASALTRRPWHGPGALAGPDAPAV
ncbi:hypothetical protein [Streptomyces sp. NPDC018031]